APAYGPGARRAPVVPIAVTLGDPAGIGPDITVQSWCAREAHNLHPFAVYGSARVLRERARTLGLDAPAVEVDGLADVAQGFSRALPVVRPAATGVRAPDAGADADAGIVASIESATTSALSGAALALVTNPIAKKSLRSIPLAYPGHTAFLGQLAARH